MDWLELHLDTSPVGIEPMSALLEQQGVEGLIIEDETDFHDFLENNHQYWDYVDEDLMAQKDAPFTQDLEASRPVGLLDTRPQG